MTPEQHLSTIRSSGEALVEAAAVDLDTTVPSCPAWTTAALVSHLVGVMGLAANAIEDPVGPRPGERPEADSTALPAFRAALEHLLEVLESGPLDRTAWSWVPDADASWWARRIAHELTVHRYDIEQAVGAEPTLPPAEMAADGIDEWLETYFVGRRGARGLELGEPASIHLHCTDTEGEWLVRLDSESVELTREHAKGDLAVRGPAVRLWAWCWRRGGRDELELFGDEDLAASIEALTF